MGTQRKQNNLGWFVGFVVMIHEIFGQPGLLRPSTKYFFFTEHYLNSFAPIAQQAGQAAVLGRPSS
jgi:hypothetical protein